MYFQAEILRHPCDSERRNHFQRGSPSPAEFRRPWRGSELPFGRRITRFAVWLTVVFFLWFIFWMYTSIRWACTIIICENIHFYVYALYMSLPYYMIFAENQIEPIWFWSKCKLYQNSRKLKKNTISKVEMSCQGCASPGKWQLALLLFQGALGHPTRPLRECHHKLWECCRHCDEELESPAQRNPMKRQEKVHSTVPSSPSWPSAVLDCHV